MPGRVSEAYRQLGQGLLSTLCSHASAFSTWAGFGGSNVHCLIRGNKPRAPPAALTANGNGLTNGNGAHADGHACNGDATTEDSEDGEARPPSPFCGCWSIVG